MAGCKAAGHPAPRQEAEWRMLPATWLQSFLSYSLDPAPKMVQTTRSVSLPAPVNLTKTNPSHRCLAHTRAWRLRLAICISCHRCCVPPGKIFALSEPQSYHWSRDAAGWFSVSAFFLTLGSHKWDPMVCLFSGLSSRIPTTCVGFSASANSSSPGQLGVWLSRHTTSVSRERPG